MTRSRAGLAVLGLLACLLAAGRAADRLGQSRPPRPPSQQMGVGPLLGSVLAGSFRPLLLTYLWMRTDTLYAQGRSDELYRTFRTMLALYPDNEGAREFLGWHLAFNLKAENEERRELAWRWARRGLDTLRETRAGRETLAYWFMAQCGQNAWRADRPLRYFGPAWEDERWWRARVAAWTREHADEELDRFAAGLWALGDRNDFIARGARASLLERIVYEDWILRGATGRYAEAQRAMTNWVRENVEMPVLARALQDGVSLMRLLHEPGGVELRRLEDRVEERSSFFPYRAALAAISLGARQRREKLVEIGLRALARLDHELDPERRLFAEERKLGSAWLRHLTGVAGGDPPPLPSR